MASRSDKEDATRKHILDTAKQLFQHYGSHKVTMDDIAKAAGKGKSSLYYYYKSKDDIQTAVMDHEVVEMMAEIEAAIQKVKGAEPKMKAFFTAKLKGLHKRREQYRSVEKWEESGGNVNLTAEGHALRRRYIAHESRILGRILEEGIAAGELKPMEVPEREGLVFILITGLHGLEKEMILQKKTKWVEAAMDSLSAILINGIKI